MLKKLLTFKEKGGYARAHGSKTECFLLMEWCKVDLGRLAWKMAP